jgi:hypothetical protein
MLEFAGGHALIPSGIADRIRFVAKLRGVGRQGIAVESADSSKEPEISFRVARRVHQEAAESFSQKRGISTVLARQPLIMIIEIITETVI